MTSALISSALVSGEGARTANTGQLSTEQPTEYSKTLLSNVACKKDQYCINANKNPTVVPLLCCLFDLISTKKCEN